MSRRVETQRKVPWVNGHSYSTAFLSFPHDFVEGSVCESTVSWKGMGFRFRRRKLDVRRAREHNGPILREFILNFALHSVILLIIKALPWSDLLQAAMLCGVMILVRL
jgi:hypothetical protein